MGEHARRVGGSVPLLVVLLLGAVSWEVGEAGGKLKMGQLERQLSAGLECGGDSMAGCFSDEEEFALDSETNRMLQSDASSYLANLVLKKGGVQCKIRGRSYTSCGSPAKSTFQYNRCSGRCLRPPNVNF